MSRWRTGRSARSVPKSGRAEVIDGSCCYLSQVDRYPVHVYGTLASRSDRIGVYQGVTSMVEAGGPGIDTLDEFAALTMAA